MKFLHLADLHLGKYLHNLSLIASGDQPFWVDQILNYVAAQKPDAVVIAGDVYDRGVPAKEAIPVLSRLLTGISRMNVPVFLVAGNHDGGERLEFVSELLTEQNVYIAGTVQKEMVHVTRDYGDGYGPVTFWLMPYLFPGAVRVALGLEEDEITTYTEAVQRLLEAQDIDFTQRNVLIAHQTVMNDGNGPEHSKSETAIGGVGGIEASVFEGFDYVALGHIHGAQPVGSDRIRYAGSPLCYHFSEAGQKKGPLMVTLADKDTMPAVEMQTLPPLHPVRPTIKGKLSDIISAEQSSVVRGEYVQVVLTDDWVEPGTNNRLDALFASHDCRLLDLGREFISARKGPGGGEETENPPEERTLDEEFVEFYRRQTKQADPTRADLELIRFAAHQVRAESAKTDDELIDDLIRFAMKQEVNGK